MTKSRKVTTEQLLEARREFEETQKDFEFIILKLEDAQNIYGALLKRASGKTVKEMEMEFMKSNNSKNNS